MIVTSATIDTQRFSDHFGGAPVIEVSGRTFPVELRWRPLVGGEEDDPDLVGGICRAVSELIADGPDGDILVFCAGERDIRDAAAAIEAMELRFTEVLPLYARLSAAEQHRVFAPHPGRRIVLATNVAETSLTVPGIRSVIDPGYARISRYSARTKVQRLPIEPISQASANQRAGRCGRVAPGVCIRLYAEDDFASRPEFTEPEILRTNLASVILRMADARLGDVVGFPFVEAPDTAQVSDGVRLLGELGAIKDDTAARRGQAVRLTPVGRRLARLPVDPRLGRMLVEAERQGCLREVEALVAGLAIQDPRERPAAAQPQADAAHRRFWAPDSSDHADADSARDGSDVAALLRLWDYLRIQRRALSGNAFRRLCRDEYLHYLRIREWQDLHAQIRDACRALGMVRNGEPASPDRVHIAVLSGLLSHIGLLDERTTQPARGDKRRRGPREYLGARGVRFAINPGSAAARLSPPLVMAVELVETSRLWARTVAPIQEAWIEEVGAHLIKRHYSEPRWSAKGGQVVATMRATLLGVPIVAGRQVSFGSVDPATAREIFIQAALVEGQWHGRHRFVAHNREVRKAAEDLQQRTRRYDLVVDDRTIADFYAARIPDDVVSVAHFETWWRAARATEPHRLDLSLDHLLVAEQPVDADDFPQVWSVGGLGLPVDYSFEPGASHDGLTVAVDLTQLNQLNPDDFTWQVPGHRQELATALIRGLPKQVRASLVPAPDRAAAALDWLAAHPQAGVPFPTALGMALRTLTGVEIPDSAWQVDRIPDHLRIRFRVLDDGRVVGEGTDLPAMAAKLGGHVHAVLNESASDHVRPASTTWTFGTIAPETGGRVAGYPGLVDRSTEVAVEVFADPSSAATAHLRGLRRLIALTTPDPTTWVVSRLSQSAKLALAVNPYPSVPALLADCRLRAIGDLQAAEDGWTVRDARAFESLRDRVRSEAADRMRTVVNAAAEVLSLHAQARRVLPQVSGAASHDIDEQLKNLIYPGFVGATPEPHWGRLPRYLRAVLIRLEGLRTNPGRDRPHAEVINAVEDEYAELCASYPPGPLPGAVADVGWLLEELRVGLFAQSLGTAIPVSAKRVRTALARVPRGTVAR